MIVVDPHRPSRTLPSNYLKSLLLLLVVFVDYPHYCPCRTPPSILVMKTSPLRLAVCHLRHHHRYSHRQHRYQHRCPMAAHARLRISVYLQTMCRHRRMTV